MQNDVQDKLTAILAEMNYTLVDPVPLPADPAPVLDQYIPTSHTAKVRTIILTKADTK